MKKIFAALTILLLVSLLFACTGDNFDDLVITAGDVSDIEPGKYTLLYSIKNYDKFLQKYPDMEIYVTAVDEYNATVPVTNNRVITVEKGRTYTIRIAIYATVDGEIAQKTKYFTVTATKTDPEVILYIGNTVYRRYSTIKYGDSLDISDIPAVPDYDIVSTGYNLQIQEKKWAVNSEYLNPDQGKNDYDELTELSQANLTSIKNTVRVYAVYVYKKTLKTFNIVFHNNGGSETDTISLPYLSNVFCPAYPTKANFVFDGWYTDEALTNKYNWTVYDTVTRNYDLYAKWLPATEDAVNDLYQYEVVTDPEGYRYCLAKPKAAMIGAVTLPNNNGNLPVKGLSNMAFLSMDITAVTIPAHYVHNTYRAFDECHYLEAVYFEEHCILGTLQKQMFHNCTSLTTIELPDSIVQIDEGCFDGCTSLTSIVLPDIYKVAISSFANSGLTEITIPNTVTIIGDNAFGGSGNLTTVTIGAGSDLTSLSSTAFTDTAVTEITLPSYFEQNHVYPLEGTGITVTYHPAQ